MTSFGNTLKGFCGGIVAAVGGVGVGIANFCVAVNTDLSYSESV